jgi:hypothetical protein
MADQKKCFVCRGDAILPYTTECSHTFCYLCLKSAYELSQACPECGAGLSSGVYEHAAMQTPNPVKTSGSVWLYGGRNDGWWEYDPVSQKRLEEGYEAYLNSLSTGQDANNLTNEVSIQNALPQTPTNSNPRSDNSKGQMNLMILNRPYLIDFERMTQTPVSGYGYPRPIKRRDESEYGSQVKGVAGLRNYVPAAPLDDASSHHMADSSVRLDDTPPSSPAPLPSSGLL